MPLVLNNTNKSLVAEILESPTNQPDYVTSYADHTYASFYEGSSDGTLTDATTTTIVPAPSANDMTRTIKYISIHNNEVSNSITTIVKLSNDTNKRVIRKAILAPGSTLTYHDDVWEIYNLDSAYTDGWIPAGETWEYASADDPTYTLTISGADLTGKYQAGQKVKLTQTTVKYFIITAVAYSAGSDQTTLTIYGGTDYDLANATITYPYFSMVKVPFGFPMDPNKWTIAYTSDAISSQANPSSGQWYNVGSHAISVPIGAWHLSYQTNPYVQSASTAGAVPGLWCCLSTTSNGSTDADFRAWGYSNHVNLHHYYPFTRSKRISVAAKTTYYLNISSYNTLGTGADAIGYYTGFSYTCIYAICAYL